MSTARWTEGAACTPEDLPLFFPTRRSGRFSADNYGAEAKAICAGCEIRERCLLEALKEEVDEIPHGIRGGLDERERTQLLRVGAA